MPSFIKDKMSKKDEQKMQDMQKDIDAAEAEMEGQEAEPEDAKDSTDAPEAEAQDAQASTEAPEQEAEADAEEKEPDVETLKKKIASLEAEARDREDKMLRLRADFENYRRRSTKEQAELGDTVTQALIKDLLPIIDNFDRAMSAEQKDGDAFKKGVEMIYTQLGEILKKDGLEVIETEGKKFDPQFHQAVMRVENPDLPDDTIAQELQKGYMVKGRVIRPSMVQVVSNS